MRAMKRRISTTVVLAAAAVALSLIPGTAGAQENLFDGRPVFSEGRDLGYWVWRNGDKWSVRWTTLGAKRHFTGVVTAEGGSLKGLKRIDVESERKVIRPGRAPHVVRGRRGKVRGVAGGRAPVVVERTEDKIAKDGDARIRWSSRTDDDIDGFDFEVGSKVTALRFAMEIDGQSRAALVECGRGNRHPPGQPVQRTAPLNRGAGRRGQPSAGAGRTGRLFWRVDYSGVSISKEVSSSMSRRSECQTEQ